jgi:hypothetical protein
MYYINIKDALTAYIRLLKYFNYNKQAEFQTFQPPKKAIYPPRTKIKINLDLEFNSIDFGIENFVT